MPNEALAGLLAPAGHRLQDAGGDDVAGKFEESSSDDGASSDGLRISALPAASAGPSFQTAMFSG